MGPSVVVIGNFDGVHPGHAEVLAEAQRLEPDLPLLVVTFWPHPLQVLRPETAPMLLTGLEERIERLSAAGADRVEVVPFTHEFSTWPPERFVAEVLLPLNPARVVVGANFRFGHRAAGNVDTLAELAAGRFAVTALPLVRFNDEDTCSTLIRAALAAGEVGHAAEHLGRPFAFRGVVARGDQRGRVLGFPTANLPVPARHACPADGVYAGWLTRRDHRGAHGEDLPHHAVPERWPAAISVGTNPTFDGVARRVESYVLDRDDLELYDAPVQVEFISRLRGQVRYDSIDALIAQMEVDVALCRERLGLG
jgi:riboflavin kinase/FMN adenylyltransferase